MGKKDKNSKEEEVLTRIAIVNADKCKPSKCRQECKKSCPVVRMGAFPLPPLPTLPTLPTRPPLRPRPPWPPHLNSARPTHSLRRQILHRGGAEEQDRMDFGGPLHRLQHLHQGTLCPSMLHCLVVSSLGVLLDTGVHTFTPRRSARWTPSRSSTCPRT